jgi:hypothetical protein
MVFLSPWTESAAPAEVKLVTVMLEARIVVNVRTN